ncbi:MMPL family transporter [Mobilicoccus massiliensis]|uniref:MMPL family transporter n=1 Tax=Mobilicoccus massiliensis TaxID=1522310 RepID=UPI00058F2A44|nr:MMPL family transporter [Mobilicoccus massiliensis]
MSVFLYRLGRFAARRAWIVVATWALILGIVGGGAATLQKPFTKELTIPGTEFQQVLDDLDRSLPDAAGGRAGVVFSTVDGTPFTPEQKKAVAAVTASWDGIDGVDEATDPFATQHDLDEGRRKLADGRTKLADGEKEIRENTDKLAEGKEKLADGRQKIDENAAKLAEGESKLTEGEQKLADGRREIARNEARLDAARAELDAGQRKIDEGRPQLAAGREKLRAGQAELEANRAKIAEGERQLAQARAKVEAGEAQLAPAEKKLADGRRRLAAGKAELADGRRELEAGKNKVADGRRQLDAGRQKISAGRAQLPAGQQRIDGGRAQLEQSRAQADALARELGDDDPQVVEARRQVEAKEAELSAAQRRLDGQKAELQAAEQALPRREAELDAAAKKLAAKESELEAGETQIQEQEAALRAGEKQLAEKSAPLVQARRTLDEKTAELQAGKRKLAEGQRQLDAGRATLNQKAAELETGQRKIDAGRAKLADGQRKLEAGKAELARGQAEIAKNRTRLNAGKEQLAQGRIDIERAAKQLRSGEAKLADARTTIADKKVELRRGERRLALIDGLRAVNTRGDVAMSSVSFDVPINEVTPETKAQLPQRASDLAAEGVQVDYSKDIADNLEIGGISEVIGLLIAAVILFVMLGSLLASGLPLLIALIGVGTGILSVLALTHWVEMSDITPALAIMLGLAVGIDYALFIVHRHRENLAQGETDVEESIGRATGTAGSAVLFAGATVVVALAALTLVDIPFLGIMGLAAAGTVTAAVLVALTLTPALLKLIGMRVLSPRARRSMAAAREREEAEAATEDAEERRAEESGGHAHVRGHGWGGLVTNHPVLAGIAGTLLLLLIAIPAASLKLGLPDASQDPQDSTSYRSYMKIEEGFGPGQNAAILAVAKVPAKEASNLTENQLTDLELDVAEQLKAHDDVAYVIPAASSEDKQTLVFQIVPEGGPNDDSTQQLIHELRDDRSAIIDSTVVDSVGFAGQTVANIDMSELLAKALPTYLAVVVGISIVLLLLVFRSIVVPLLATGGFLLSVAASLGAVVAAYQWGWGGALFGVEAPGVILSFLPTLVIGILFGLAMDYQMFLVSGMREAWAGGHTARTAVRTGFSHGAKVVTAAALIMTGVFSSFMHSPTTMIRPIGFALAAGVLFDAFVVRMTLMPSVMHLLGEKAWYLPRWLDRVLPDLDVEGTRLIAQREAADEGAENPESGPAPAAA